METNGYRLLLPEGTLDYFNISDVKESSTEIVIYLEEKNEAPQEYSESKVESKGFYDPIVVQDFPIRGKKVFLNIRRRRWVLKDENRYVSRNWKLVAQGSRMTQELEAGCSRQPYDARICDFFKRVILIHFPSAVSFWEPCSVSTVSFLKGNTAII